ncbi:IpaD/SipD/SspD family type III secretion system needle tip protein [Hafnia paralvei]|uniref:IpaD/SipD/SspD family type III secretion system needle tip protein n=1 Tax=Hafnia paralvei TaxID=546367 RepID=UPI00300C9524
MTTFSPVTASAVTYRPVSTASKAEAAPSPQTTVSDIAFLLPQDAFALCGSEACQRLNTLTSTVSSDQVTPSTLTQVFDRQISQLNKKEILSSERYAGSVPAYQSARQKNQQRLSGMLTTLSATINRNSFQTSCSLNKVTGQAAHAQLGSRSVGSESYADFWNKIAEDLGSINTSYVEFYSNLMESYTEVFQQYAHVQSAESQCVKEGSDGNHIKFDPSSLNNQYEDFESFLDKTDASLGSVPNWATMPESQQAEMKSTLAPAFTVDDNGKISIDRSAYTNARTNFPPAGDISTAQYNAWLTTFNTAGSTFQSNMQSFAQRYSQANTTFDNLNKVLSSAITSLSDSLKTFLQF